MVDSGTRWDAILERIDDFRYRIPQTYRTGMRVPAVVYSSPELIGHACHDLSLEQLANVACLPGVVRSVLAMPDMHQGYGFPIGGVAAMDPESGVVSPGGVGFDINCGVRLLSSRLTYADVGPRLPALVDGLFRAVPCGVGQKGPLPLDERSLSDVLASGAAWAVSQGWGRSGDLEQTEEGGCIPGSDFQAVSARARERGRMQLGTLGSGNHFLEVQRVDAILEPAAASTFGLFPDQVCLMIHCGSRGLGHQVCTDHVSTIKPTMSRYAITVADRELSCAPIDSDEGRVYLSAMAASANFAFANRQVIGALAEAVFQDLFGRQEELSLVYDVAHNMAKFERHKVDGQEKVLLVHRKGATRAFPGGRDEVPAKYRSCGQPVIVPGDMGRASYVLVGTERALDETFASVCHGAGRLLSRTAAKKGRGAASVQEELAARGVIARATTSAGLTEERPEAYKPIDLVVAALSASGLARPVARLKPVGVIKG